MNATTVLNLELTLSAAALGLKAFTCLFEMPGVFTERRLRWIEGWLRAERNRMLACIMQWQPVVLATKRL